MWQVHRNGSDVSGAIKSITPIEYRTNDDGTFELPEIFIGTTSSGFFVDDTITIYENATIQVSFYVAAIEYDYATKMYSLRCPHILYRLTRYKARNISLSWSGISTPSFAQYNHQTSDAQGDNIWRRQYWQVLFLMQTLIRRATGLPIASIDVSVGSEQCQYYQRYWDPLGGWTTGTRNYENLGVAAGSVVRLGTKKHTDWNTTDFNELQGLPNCLDVLRWLCAACGLSIGIFRADYKIGALTPSAPPVDSDTMGRRNIAFEPYRHFVGTGSRLVGGAEEYRYGYYDWTGHFVPYTYGVPDAERTIEPYQADVENTGTALPRTLSLGFPSMFSLYFITNDGTYQSHIASISDGQQGLNWLGMWVSWLFGIWMNAESRDRYETVLKTIQDHHRSVEIDIANQKKTYEVLS